MKTKNTVIYASHFNMFENLSNEQVGELIKAIGNYVNGQEYSIEDLMVQGIWLMMRRDFDKQMENYEATCKAKRENGKKGGRPSKTSNEAVKSTSTVIDGPANKSIVEVTPNVVNEPLVELPTDDAVNDIVNDAVNEEVEDDRYSYKPIKIEGSGDSIRLPYLTTVDDLFKLKTIIKINLASEMGDDFNDLDDLDRSELKDQAEKIVKTYEKREVKCENVELLKKSLNEFIINKQ